MIWELQVGVATLLETYVSELLHNLGSMGVSVQDTGTRPVFSSDTPFGACLVRGYFEESVDQSAIESKVALLLTTLGLKDLPKVRWVALEDQDWQESWKQHFKPLPIGETVLVLPSWLEPPEHNQRKIIRIDPEMAFGSGSHETTQGCLEALERHAKVGPLGHVLDLGTGSGILTIGALLLGADMVTATDNDPIAVETCNKNVQANWPHATAAPLTALHTETIPPGQYDTIVANILAPVLLAFLHPNLVQNQQQPGISTVLKPDGSVILSGILVEQITEIAEACKRVDLNINQQHILGDWAVLVANHTC
ncbi:MAG: 50S ribosomal protein L11 methyltransferase [Magnetococcales bacterium]|nr:50S ribosomal protein L11 methyltransferase [Magnetococcales bacterium]